MYPCLIAKEGDCQSFPEDDFAGVTQLVEFLPSKQVVAGSSPVSRSTDIKGVLALPKRDYFFRLLNKLFHAF